VGEVGRIGFTSRREIGHGNLAQRAIKPVLPDYDDFPYTIRIVSEIMESNGSSSMASVCGGSLSLMNAGAPLKSHVAGIAMGLITDGKRNAILSDILGAEDHLGDMDFKIAGTAEGITAIQLDLKIEGVSFELMKQALEQAREGRLHILNLMDEALPEANEISQYAPRIFTITINPEKIGALIGPGGKNIKKIIEDTECEINVDDDGNVTVAGANSDKCSDAIELVKVKSGDDIRVKLIKVDDQGRLDFSRKALLPKPEGYVERPRRESNSRGRRSGGFRKDRNRGHRR